MVGIVSKMSLIINSNTEYITDIKNISDIKYCCLNIYNKRGETLSDRIFKVELSSVQSKFDYPMYNSFQENDCYFIVKKECDITNEDIIVDYIIKKILRDRKIDNILNS